ncbi:MAG: hypothetical protein PWP41_937 [Moorella sp. (in: firmicutes)]|nr:hypothetical protein [Moorella sp. (in: firmicutes)]
MAVDIDLLAWQFPGICPVLEILGSAAPGAMVVFLPGLGRQVRVNREIRQLKHANSRLAGDPARREQGPPGATGTGATERKQEI